MIVIYGRLIPNMILMMVIMVMVIMMMIPITLPMRTMVITGCMNRISINNTPANVTPPDSGKNAPSSSGCEYDSDDNVEQYEYRLASIR